MLFYLVVLGFFNSMNASESHMRLELTEYCDCMEQYRRHHKMQNKSKLKSAKSLAVRFQNNPYPMF